MNIYLVAARFVNEPQKRGEAYQLLGVTASTHIAAVATIKTSSGLSSADNMTFAKMTFAKRFAVIVE